MNLKYKALVMQSLVSLKPSVASVQESSNNKCHCFSFTFIPPSVICLSLPLFSQCVLLHHSKSTSSHPPLSFTVLNLGKCSTNPDSEQTEAMFDKCSSLYAYMNKERERERERERTERKQKGEKARYMHPHDSSYWTRPVLGISQFYSLLSLLASTFYLLRFSVEEKKKKNKHPYTLFVIDSSHRSRKVSKMEMHLI